MNEIYSKKLKNEENERLLRAKKEALSLQKNLRYKLKLNQAIADFMALYPYNPDLKNMKIEPSGSFSKIKIWGENARFEFVDKGDSIIDNSCPNCDLKLKAKMMIDTALAKGWSLDEIGARGNPEFLSAVEEELKIRSENQEMENEKTRENYKAREEQEKKLQEAQKQNVSAVKNANVVDEKPNYSHVMSL